MKRKAMLAVLLAGCMAMAPAAVYAEEAETTAAETEAAQESDAAETEAADEADASAETGEAETLSDDLYSFQVKIGDDIYQFPMTYADFTAKGWALGNSDDPQTSVGSNSYGSVSFYNGQNKVYGTVFNLGINAVPLEECLIGGVDIEKGDYGVNLDNTPVELPGGIVMGQSTLEDVKAAYGDPSDTYEGDLYDQLTYKKDSYEYIRLYVYKESGVLEEADFQNLVEPEGFDKGEVSTETPQIVSDYTAPTEMGEDYLSTVVEFCGDLYQLPAPVSAFLANGWEMQDVEEGAYVSGGSMDFVDMMKNNQSVHFSIYNETRDAVTYENCFVEELELGDYDSEAMTFTLSGGVTLGSKKADIIALAEEKQYIYSEDGDYLNVYANQDLQYDNYAHFYFREDDPDTVASLTYLNRNLPSAE